MPVGESIERLAEGFDNRIYSVQVFGRAEVIAFNYFGYTGVFTRIEGSFPDLRALPVSDNPEKNWARRISSIQVNFRHGAFRRLPPPTWGRPQAPRAGACFYRGRDFEGEYFCVSIKALRQET